MQWLPAMDLAWQDDKPVIVKGLWCVDIYDNDLPLGPDGEADYYHCFGTTPTRAFERAVWSTTLDSRKLDFPWPSEIDERVK